MVHYPKYKSKGVYITVAVIVALFLVGVATIAWNLIPQNVAPLPTISDTSVLSPGPPIQDSDFVCEKCNVVIVGMTNVRPDHMGLYGYSRDTTPKIDAFAKRSVVFENAFTPTSWTLPVVASILTSLYPFQHGVMGLSGSFNHLGANFTTLADILRQNGYRTAAFTGGRDLLPNFGVTSRFDENFYPDSASDPITSATLSPAVQSGVPISTSILMSHYGSFGFSVPKAIDWMASHRDKPFFAYVQGFDAHCPFAVPQKNERFTKGLQSNLDHEDCHINFIETAPVEVGKKKYFTVFAPPPDPRTQTNEPLSQLISEEDVEYMAALYDGEINLVDEHIGKLLDFMETDGLLENTLVILLSEHGDMLGKHGRFMRSGPLRGTYYDDVLQVPLVLYFPGNLQQGVHRPQIVELTDLAPTILDALSITPPAQFVGRSLRDTMTRDAPGAERAFAGSLFFPGINPYFPDATLIAALRTPEWKLIYEDIFKSPPDQNAKPLSSFLDPHKEDVEVRTQLFDIKNDPEELIDVSAQHPDIVETLRREMDQRIKSF